MLRFFSTLLLFAFACSGAFSQSKSETKHFPRGTYAGEISLLEQWTEYDGTRSSAVYTVEVPVSACYSLSAIANLQKSAVIPVSVDRRPAGHQLAVAEDGWQKVTATAVAKNETCGIYLSTGRHIIALSQPGNVPPMADQLSLSRSGTHQSLDKDWSAFSARLSQWMMDKPASNLPAADKYSEMTGKVLNNPAGNYEHAIDTAFAYTTFLWVYLTAGTTYTFTTATSTKDPVIHLFDVNNIDTRSWYNDDSNGNWESSLTVTIPATGNYALLVRPYYSNQSGTTSLYQNSVLLLSNTPIGGLRLATNARTGDLNYFTARLSGSTPDTRLFTLTSPGTNVTGYNDDYANAAGGTWNWGLSSRIKKNYAAASNYVFVCAYNASKTGICDVYMGLTSATLPTSNEAGNFPQLKGEDAMQTAPNSASYNCIAWTGGITTSWVWPIDPSSTWYVANNPLASFDKFYSNNPQRYPGAWNYTRAGATAVNAVVDLWKTASAYTHGSVTKPGNDNPHGYDWESKPGSFDRTVHPRNALENPNWYGSVTNYYKFAGSYSKNAAGITTDVDAVAAGLAIIDKASLSNGAQQKLRTMLTKTETNFAAKFEILYQAWDKTKERNKSLSDPFAYCNNTEFERLAAFCQKNPQAAMLLVFDKYVNSGDHFIGKLMLSLTTAKYGHLLEQVRNERIENPNDAQGRYRIHGDHDNGVLYIEKILQQLQDTDAGVQAEDIVRVIVSPNPIKDQFTVQVTLRKDAVVSVQAIAARSRASRQLQSATTFPAGTHLFTGNAKTLNAAAGEIIAIQVTVDGVLYTVKALLL